MKKVLLSAFVIISFIGYALFMQKKGAVQQPVIVPTTIGKNTVTIQPSVTAAQSTPTAALIQPATSQSTVTPQPVIPTATPKPSSQYKDGTYTGSVADAFYGNIQVQVAISGGRITNVQFLQYPNDRDTSIQINQQADPMLAQEAIQIQSANVDIISGATDSSQAFIQSMQAALNQAKS